MRRLMAGAVLKPGEFLGTAAYSSLEALQHVIHAEGGAGGFDLQRNDSYSAGAMLFHLLTGALPVVLPEEEEYELIYELLAHEAAILRWVLARRIRTAAAAAHGTCRCHSLAGNQAIILSEPAPSVILRVHGPCRSATTWRRCASSWMRAGLRLSASRFSWR